MTPSVVSFLLDQEIDISYNVGLIIESGVVTVHSHHVVCGDDAYPVQDLIQHDIESVGDFMSRHIPCTSKRARKAIQMAINGHTLPLTSLLGEGDLSHLQHLPANVSIAYLALAQQGVYCIFSDT